MAASATNTTQKKIFRFGITTLIFSNLELNVFIKIIQSLKDFGLLMKSATKNVDNEVKEQKRGYFISMLAATLDSI